MTIPSREFLSTDDNWASMPVLLHSTNEMKDYFLYQLVGTNIKIYLNEYPVTLHFLMKFQFNCRLY